MSENTTRFPAFFRKEIWIAVVLFAATLALFWPATGYDFVRLDDPLYVVDNPDVTDGFTWAGVETAFGKMQQCLWIPLLNVSYMLDVEGFGSGPGGFHFTNILLHALNTVLFFILLRRWTGRNWIACWGALFWAWHPLRVESVAWISCRKDVLSGLFFLLCLWAYVRSMEEGRRSRGWFWAAAGFLALGLMSKSTLMATPFLLLSLDVWPLNRVRPEGRDLASKLPRLVMEKWAFWLLSVLSGVLAVGGHAAQDALQTDGFRNRVWRLPVHAVYYLGQTFWPRGLRVLCGDLEMGVGLVAGSILVFAGIGMAAWVWRRRWPAFAVGWLWYLAILLPVAGVVGFGAQSRADRYTYLPAMGLILMLVSGIPERTKGRRAWFVAGLASVLAAGALTARQLPVWRHSGALMGRVLEADPHHIAGNANLGIWQWEQGERGLAQESFRRAWAMMPVSPRLESIANEAHRLVLQGKSDLVRAMLRPVLNGSQATPLVHQVYGMACLHAGEFDEAIRHLNQALAMDPQALACRAELVRAYSENGEEDKAREQAGLLKGWPGGEIRKAVDLFPFYVHRWQENSRPYAWVYFRRLAEKEAENVAVLNNIAWMAATDKHSPPESVPLALAWAEHAAELTGRGDASILDTLAAAQAAGGDFVAATATAREALALATGQGNARLAEKIEGRLRLYREGMDGT